MNETENENVEKISESKDGLLESTSSNSESVSTWFGDAKLLSCVQSKILFSETLNIYNRFTGKFIGKKTIDIFCDENDELFKRKYNVKVTAEWTIITNANNKDATSLLSSDNFKEVLLSVVSADLKPISESLEMYCNEKLLEWWKYSWLDNSSGLFVYSSRSSDENNLMYSISEQNVPFLLTEGSMYVFIRLSTLSNKFGSFNFLFPGREDLLSGKVTGGEHFNRYSKEIDGFSFNFSTSNILEKEFKTFDFISNFNSFIVLDHKGKLLNREFPKKDLWLKRIYVPKEPQKESNPILSRTFNDNIELISEYRSAKFEISAAHNEYISGHPELYDLMSDFLQLVLHRKPHDVFSFTIQYFQNISPQ